ncbi:MAG: BspA family leucine-rich repeat surface protein [Lachnospiraceae bacterium]|nr:BspA family leucine-rich repeat surface protein [Lachnospiraceae bacterium]
MRKKLYKFVAIIAAVSMIFCDSSIISLAGEIVPGAEETFFEADETDDAGDEKENVDGADEVASEILPDGGSEEEEIIVIQEDGEFSEDEETSEEESDEVEDGEGISEEAASEENIDSEFESDENDETGEIPEDEESVEDEENAENIDAPEDGEAIDDEDISEEESEDVESIEELLAAEDNIAQGTSNEVKWVIDKNGKLTVSGKGDWKKFSTGYGPWDTYRDKVLTAVVNLAGVTDFSNMFYFCENLTEIDLSGSDTSEVTNMSYMFYGCRSLTKLNLSGLITSQVTDMRLLFADCESLSEVNLSSFDTSLVEDMSGMFIRCSSLESLDLSNFNTSQVMHMEYMFASCESLTTLNLSSFNTSKVTDMDSLFYKCASLKSLDLCGFNTAKITDMSEMFRGCSMLTTLDLSSFNTSKVTDMCLMFGDCESLTELNLNSFNTSKVKDMSYMFYNCKSFTALNLSNFKTLSNADIVGIFKKCAKLETLDIRNFSISEKSNVGDLISDLKYLTKIVTPKQCSCILSLPTDWKGSLWKDSNGILYTELPGTAKTLKREINYSAIAGGNSNAVSWLIDENGKLTVSGTGDWKLKDGKSPWYAYRNDILTAEVTLTGTTDLANMFAECGKMTSVDLTGLDTSKVTGMNWMFYKCSKLTTLDLSGLNTSKLTSMSGMLCDCAELKSVNLNGFEMKNVTDVNYLFDGCTKLLTLDLSNCDWSKVTSATDVFVDCDSLIRIVTPRNVHVDVKLPSGKAWKDSYGRFFNALTIDSTDLTEDGAATSKYYITYELNGGENSADNPKSYKKNAKVDFAAPVKKGCKFEGWFDKVTDEKVDCVEGRNITVYAKWKPYTYTLTLYGNGGKYTPDGVKKAKTVESKTVSYGEIVSPDNRFERKGYTLIGWTTKKNGGGVFYQAGTPLKNLSAKNKGKVTLYAKWSANKYEIVLNNDWEYKTLYTQYGKSIKLPDKPFEDYVYSFKGWSLTPDGPVKYKNKASVKNLATSGEVRLYAVWSINTYNVKFSGNGVGKGKAPATQKGCRFNEPDCKMPENTFTYNDKLYRFDGWNTRKDGRGSHYTLGGQTALNASKNKQTIILYARWLYEYSIATDAGVVNDEAYYNESISTETMDKYFTGLAREGYYIAGWATNQKNADKGKMTYKSSFKNVAGKTLYPVYKPIKYTVKFDANGGTGKMSSMTATYGKPFTLRKNEFKRNGYTFKGWSIKKNATTATYDNKAEIGKDKPLSVTNKDVITLYAVWEKLP